MGFWVLIATGRWVVFGLQILCGNLGCQLVKHNIWPHQSSCWHWIWCEDCRIEARWRLYSNGLWIVIECLSDFFSDRTVLFDHTDRTNGQCVHAWSSIAFYVLFAETGSEREITHLWSRCFLLVSRRNNILLAVIGYQSLLIYPIWR